MVQCLPLHDVRLGPSFFPCSACIQLLSQDHVTFPSTLRRVGVAQRSFHPAPTRWLAFLSISTPPTTSQAPATMVIRHQHHMPRHRAYYLQVANALQQTSRTLEQALTNHRSALSSFHQARSDRAGSRRTNCCRKAPFSSSTSALPSLYPPSGWVLLPVLGPSAPAPPLSINMASGWAPCYRKSCLSIALCSGAGWHTGSAHFSAGGVWLKCGGGRWPFPYFLLFWDSCCNSGLFLSAAWGVHPPISQCLVWCFGSFAFCLSTCVLLILL
jgi:hypothetical protein